MERANTRAEVYAVIDGERNYQENLPPTRSVNPKRIREVSEYLTMLDHYVRHAQDAWTTQVGHEVPLDDMRKIAALAVRCMEDWGALPREVEPMTENYVRVLETIKEDHIS